MRDDIQTKGLAAVSESFALNLVENRLIHMRVKWEPQEQIYPTAQVLRKYFQSQFYQDVSQDLLPEGTFKILWEEYDDAKAKSLHHIN